MNIGDILALVTALRPMPGPQLPQLAKAPNNVTGLPIGRAALNNPPLSDPAQMLATMIGAAGAPAEIALKEAQAQEAKRRANILGQIDLGSILGSPRGGSGEPPPAPAVPSSAPGNLVPGGKLDFAGLRSLAQWVGFQGGAADIMAATALAESGGDPKAVGDRDKGGSYGVTQINQAAHGPVAQQAFGDPLRAMQLAFDISKGGTDFTPWTMWRNGQYQKYMPAQAGMSPSGAAPPPLAVVPGGAAVNIDPLALAKQRAFMALGGISGDPLQGFAQAYYQSPHYLAAKAAAEEQAKRGAGLQFLQPEERIKANEALRREWLGPGASPELQAQIQSAKTIAEKLAVLQAAGIDKNSPLGQSLLTMGAAHAAGLPATVGGTTQTPLGIYDPQTGTYKFDPNWKSATAAQAGAVSAAEKFLQERPIPGGAPGETQLVPVPGSPAEQAAREVASARGVTTNVVLDSIKKALDKSGFWTTGLVGTALQNMPGSEANDLRLTLAPLKAQTTIQQLQAMRQSSPSGGALGQVSNYENEMLRNSLAALEQSQSKAQFDQNLRNFALIFTDIVYGSPERLGEKLASQQMTRAEYDLATERRQKALEIFEGGGGNQQRLIYDPATRTLRQPGP